jgi:phosphohistidine phosphatase SixA
LTLREFANLLAFTGAVMRIRLLMLAVAAVVTGHVPPLHAQSARSTFDELKQGGFVIVIRHGRTNESAAFPRDEAPTDLTSCSGQTMLTDVGQAQARALGDAFRRDSIPVGKVLASALCRAVETARLAFGKVETTDALLIESFVPVEGVRVTPWEQRVEVMKQLVATAPPTGTNTVLLTHFPNIKAMLGIQINFGDAAIVKADGHGGIAVVGKILAREWGSL